MAKIAPKSSSPGPVSIAETSGGALTGDGAEATSSAAPETPDSPAPVEADLPQYYELNQPLPISYHLPPHIEGAVVSKNGNVISTCWPAYSRSSEELEKLIRQQSNYPPIYTLRLIGTHIETRRTTDDRTEVHTITDFDIRLDMSHLLMCPNPSHMNDPTPCQDCEHLRLLPDGIRGYRGRLVRTTGPHHEDLTAWCQAYVSCKCPIKTFTLNRGVTEHQTKILDSSCHQLVGSTSYRGHVKVKFEIKNNEITVYCDSFLNRLRFNKCVCWFFYVTCLWVIAWPVLWLSSKHFAPVAAVFAYNKPNGSPLVQSEQVFFDEWKGALRRAVISRHQGWVDSVYRAESARMDGSGSEGGVVDVRRDGNAVVRVAMGGPVRVGWGAHS